MDWALRIKPEIVIVALGATTRYAARTSRPSARTSIRSSRASRRRARACSWRGWRCRPTTARATPRTSGACTPRWPASATRPSCPFFLDGVAGNPRLNQPDGIHPTAEGYRIVVDHLWPHLAPLLAQVGRASASSSRYPYAGPRNGPRTWQTAGNRCEPAVGRPNRVNRFRIVQSPFRRCLLTPVREYIWASSIVNAVVPTRGAHDDTDGEFSLDAKYTQERGSVCSSGIQALVRLLFDQHRADLRRGLGRRRSSRATEARRSAGLDQTLERQAASSCASTTWSSRRA